MVIHRLAAHRARIRRRAARTCGSCARACRPRPRRQHQAHTAIGRQLELIRRDFFLVFVDDLRLHHRVGRQIFEMRAARGVRARDARRTVDDERDVGTDHRVRRCTGDDAHVRNLAAIERRFAGSRFVVKSFGVMNRAGRIPIGLRPVEPHPRLRGCNQMGSRPLQHLHITPHGKCVLCCEDYDEKYVVGDLTTHTIAEVLESDEIAKLRRWVYGVEEAPEDFMCRDCVFARRA